MRNRLLYLGCLVLFTLGAVFCVATSLRSAGRFSPGVVLFALWGVCPQAAGILLARWTRRSAPALWVLFVAAAIIAGGGSYVLYDAFGPHIDPQSGLVLLFLPFWELVVLVPFAAVALWFAWRTRSANA